MPGMKMAKRSQLTSQPKDCMTLTLWIGQMMSHSYSLVLPMNRNSSGTAWQPDATPVFGYILMTNHWNLMFHGNVFIRYNYQGINAPGKRSDKLTDRIDAPN